MGFLLIGAHSTAQVEMVNTRKPCNISIQEAALEIRNRVQICFAFGTPLRCNDVICELYLKGSLRAERHFRVSYASVVFDLDKKKHYPTKYPGVEPCMPLQATQIEDLTCSTGMYNDVECIFFWVSSLLVS